MEFLGAAAVVVAMFGTVLGLIHKWLKGFETRIDTKISTQISGLDSKLSTEINGLDTKLSARIDGLDTKFCALFNSLDAKLNNEIRERREDTQNLRNDIRALESRIFFLATGQAQPPLQSEVDIVSSQYYSRKREVLAR